MTRQNCSWYIDLGRRPLWSPPALPGVEDFQANYGNSDTCPREIDDSVRFSRSLKLQWMLVDFLMFLWPVTLFCGLVYLLVRGKHRDLSLHISLFAGLGMTTGVLVCVQLYEMYGGWGPPSPEFFGGVGLALGVLVGALTFRPARESTGKARSK